MAVDVFCKRKIRESVEEEIAGDAELNRDGDVNVSSIDEDICALVDHRFFHIFFLFEFQSSYEIVDGQLKTKFHFELITCNTEVTNIS